MPITTTRTTWIVGLGGIVVPDRTEEDMRDVPEGVGRREDRSERRENGDEERHSEERGMGRLLQHHLLRQEAVQEWDAGHAERREGSEGKGHRHQDPEASEASDVAGMRLVVDDAGGHEERGLEGRVVQDVEDSGEGTEGRRCAEEHRDQAEVADRREGEKRLQIMLEEGDHRAEDHRDEPGGRDDGEPFGRARENRPEARHEEDAGLHHRGGVKIGGDRRGRRHGVWQPEVEGELRRLGECAE